MPFRYFWATLYNKVISNRLSTKVQKTGTDPNLKQQEIKILITLLWSLSLYHVYVSVNHLKYGWIADYNCLGKR